MKKKMTTIASFFLALLSVGMQSCGEEYVDLEYNGNIDLNQLVLLPARQAWDGGACDVTLTALEYSETASASNQIIDLSLGMYQNRTAKVDATVDVFVNKDSLAQAISKVSQGGAYEKYAGVELLPADFYFLSGDKLKLQAGTSESEDVSLTIYSEKIIDYIQNECRANKKFALPVSINNPTGYQLNSKTHTVMYFINANYVEPAHPEDYIADGEGVADDHEKDVNGVTYKMLWHDEFNINGAPDETVWSIEEGYQRNEEDQWYKRDNLIQEGNALVITAKEERFKNPNYDPNATGGNSWKKTREYVEYTSGSMRAKKTFFYGHMEVRAKIPVKQGCWPAIWSTGNWYEWPLGGEIDMLEFYKEKIHANVAWGGWSRWSASWNSKNKPFTDFSSKDSKWAEKYHIWTMDWDENYIRIYLDGELLNETDLSTTNNHGDHGAGDGGNINPYTCNYDGFGQCMWVNLAIGGINGRPIECTFPQQYFVDYIRIYQVKK